MTAWPARALPGPPSFDPVSPRATARAICPACAASARAVPPDPLQLFLAREEEAEEAASRARVPRQPVRRDQRLHRVSLRESCRSRFPPGRAPWTPRRVPHIPLPCTSRLPLSRTGILRAAPTAARSPSCPHRWVQSSGYFWEGRPQQSREAASVCARDCAAPRRRRAWPPPGRQCTCRVRLRFRAASCRRETEAFPFHQPERRRFLRETALFPSPSW